MLVAEAGRGCYQIWGEAPRLLLPGQTATIPAGTKHWHGAAADSWMQHLAYYTAQQPGVSTEWLEPVDDEQYNKLK